MIVVASGDRYWQDSFMPAVIVNGLWVCHASKADKLMVVQGGARGLDNKIKLFADDIAERRGFEFESRTIPAEWERHDREGTTRAKCNCPDSATHCRAAGVRRNRDMFALQPQVVIGFHQDIAKSRGTKDMLNLGVDAGIPTYLISKLRWPIQ